MDSDLDGGSKRHVIELAALVAVLAVIGGLAAVVLKRKPARPPIDYKDSTLLVQALETNVERDPCNRYDAVKLLDLYLTYKNALGTLDLVATMIGRCGDDAPVHRYAVSAHTILNHYAEALAEANRAIDLAPHDLDYLSLRASVHRSFGHTDEALADYQKVLSIAPTLDPLDAVIDIHVRAHQPCKAAEAIRAFIAANGVRDSLHCDNESLEDRLKQFELQCK